MTSNDSSNPWMPDVVSSSTLRSLSSARNKPSGSTDRLLSAIDQESLRTDLVRSFVVVCESFAGSRREGEMYRSPLTSDVASVRLEHSTLDVQFSTENDQRESHVRNGDASFFSFLRSNFASLTCPPPPSSPLQPPPQPPSPFHKLP